MRLSKQPWQSGLFCGLTLAACLGLAPLEGGEPNPNSTKNLVIHEWGTFTCLQDETGHAIAGVNTDDEPVPDFVHRISEMIPRASDLAPVYYKGVPRSHRQVTMRLETPVVYFYPPAGQTAPLHASLKVGFRGGWLTEYYPDAHVEAEGLPRGEFQYARLTPNTRGGLEWSDLTIGGEGGRIPETDAAVWLAPRQVRAARVRVPGGEAEKYLFYRGVGNLRTPLTVVRKGSDNSLLIREHLDPALGVKGPVELRALWLVDVAEDGAVAFRTLGAARLTGEVDRIVTSVSPAFEEQAAPASSSPEVRHAAHDDANLAELHAEMRQALIGDGLYEDEADAMLATWNAAYFRSPGLRLFYLLPQAWTNSVLPMTCSLPSQMTRTMVGRVEIVTRRQRTLLSQIDRGPISDSAWFFRGVESQPDRNQALSQLWSGKIRLKDAQVKIPDDYRAYLDLGRFRNALILDAFHKSQTNGLGRFAEEYQIMYYTPTETAALSGAE
ncbi:MAG: hypothetical protein ACKV0T_03410 [Planctomycetales bacterium]